MIKCVLITNISMVTVRDVRTHAHALLLVDYGESDRAGPRYRARGFGVTAGEELFDVVLPSIEYVFEKDPIPSMFAGMTPMSTHGKLYVEGPPNADADDAVFALDCDSFDGKEIVFERFEGDDRRDHGLFPRLWDHLAAQVARYWHAPFVMVPHQMRIDDWRDIAYRADEGARR